MDKFLDTVFALELGSFLSHNSAWVLMMKSVGQGKDHNVFIHAFCEWTAEFGRWIAFKKSEGLKGKNDEAGNQEGK